MLKDEYIRLWNIFMLFKYSGNPKKSE